MCLICDYDRTIADDGRCAASMVAALHRVRESGRKLILARSLLTNLRGLADETGLPYQKLIDLFLLDCARKRKKPSSKWVA